MALSIIGEVLLGLLEVFGEILQSIGLGMSDRLRPKKKKQPTSTGH